MDLSKFTPDQAQAITHLDGPLLVCAGAGTGKTFTLTQRITWALAGNPSAGVEPFLNSIDEALVITYTEAAASELKSRFRASLRSAGLLDDALKVDAAWISTIHGMCSRILREHALELGMDPEFKIAMGAKSDEVRMRAISEVLRESESEGTYSRLFAEYDTFGVKNMLKDMLNQASHQTAGLDAFKLGSKPVYKPSLLREFDECAHEAAETCAKKTAEKISLAAEALDECLARGAGLDEVLGTLASLDLTRLSGEASKDFKQHYSYLKDLAFCMKGYELLQLLLDMARRVEAAYQRILQESSLVDMGDLIRKTLKAFDENPRLAAQYTSRFKLIMVDEFQDTSQLQIDMISRIAGEDAARLCTVGDSQQSIYRFQGADVGVYLNHKRDMRESGAKLVELKDNFRSHADILAFVRRVCGQEGFFAEPFLDLEAGSNGRRYCGEGPRVELVYTEFESGCTDQATLQEARAIAARFRELIDAGQKPSDMVILMGKTTHIQTYAEALREQGIPCMAEGGSHFYESAHVQHCLSLANVLANPFDTKSLMDVLASEVLPVSSDDLLLVSTCCNEQGGCLQRRNMAEAFLDKDFDTSEASPLLKHALKVLRKAWRRLGRIAPSELFMSTIADAGWIDRLSEQGIQGQAVIADIVKFVRQIHAFETEDGFGMSQVAEALHAAADTESASAGTLSVEGLQAVRLMTVHRSKGLQFPIVAVTQCFHQSQNSSKSNLFCSVKEGRVYASLLPKGARLEGEYSQDDAKDALVDTCDAVTLHANICAVERDNDHAERRRLFYVAATRASDALIIALGKRRTKNLEYKEIEKNLVDALFAEHGGFPETSGSFEYGGSEPAIYTRFDIYKENDEVDEGDGLDGEEANPEESAQETFVLLPELVDEKVPPLRLALRRKDFFSYSSLAAASDVHAVQFDSDVNGDESLAAAQPFDFDRATDFGSALHRTCEWMALCKCTDEHLVDEQALRFAEIYGVHNTERLRAAVHRWLDSDIASQAYAFTSCEPELPFAIQVAGGILEGEIDLLCSNGDGHAFIIDYKTGGKDSESPEDLLIKHGLQARCYAYAALTSGYTSVELHFVRVEHENQDESDQPQIVSFSFDKSDFSALKESIVEAYMGMLAANAG